MSTLLIADSAATGKSQVSTITATSTQITAANSVTAAAVVGITTSAGAGDSGKIPKLNASGVFDSSFLTGSQALIILQDQKSGGTAGGTFTSGAFRTRVLSTEVADTGGNCTLSSNQFALLAGTYRINAYAQANQVAGNVLRLQNISDSTTTIEGMANYSQAGISDGDNTAVLFGRFTIASTKTFELQHRCETTRATNGFGIASNVSTNEIYTTVILTKE